MLALVREVAPKKIQQLVQDNTLTDRERCVQLHVYLTQQVNNPKVRIQTEASVCNEGPVFHVLLKEREGTEQVRLIFTHTEDGNVVLS